MSVGAMKFEHVSLPQRARFAAGGARENPAAEIEALGASRVTVTEGARKKTDADDKVLPQAIACDATLTLGLRELGMSEDAIAAAFGAILANLPPGNVRPATLANLIGLPYAAREGADRR